ncbi:hypothetical protein PULV_a0257 [Pseudoalteromonas ulvae UL12]|nr:hypothetical protein [Pseudoalteromonas ulvae UL12]
MINFIFMILSKNHGVTLTVHYFGEYINSVAYLLSQGYGKLGDNLV